MAKISVIIPVYNTGPYLARCLDSVCEQTLDDIEIICVNDGSPDGSGDILKEYAARDPRVLYIQFERNQGVSTARNVGMAAATGTYLGFVDSDDAIAPDFYEKLYSKASENWPDIVKGAMKEFTLDGEVLLKFENINNQIREHKDSFLYNYTTAIYKTALLHRHGVTFPRTPRAQDEFFLLNVGAVVQSVEVIDDAFYLYIRRTQSCTDGSIPMQTLHAILSSYDEFSSFMETRSIKPEAYAIQYANAIILCMKWHNQVSPEEREGVAQLTAQKMIWIYEQCREKQLMSQIMKERAPYFPFFCTLLAAQDVTGVSAWGDLSDVQKLRALVKMKQQLSHSKIAEGGGNG